MNILIFVAGFGFIMNFDKCYGVVKFVDDPDEAQQFDTVQQAKFIIDMNKAEVCVLARAKLFNVNSVEF